VIQALRPEHPHYDGPPWQDAVRATGCWAAPRQLQITTSQPADPQRIVDYITSISWFAALPDDQLTDSLTQVETLVYEGHTPAELPVHVTIGLTTLLSEADRTTAPA
jgi:hypothetical protein